MSLQCSGCLTSDHALMVRRKKSSGSAIERNSDSRPMIRRFLKNYLPRHRNRTNQLLHLIGVPLTFVGTPVSIIEGVEWYWPVLCFLGGYAFQFAGHAVEGNDAGEIVFLKKKLGMPYTEYGPQSECSRGLEQRDDRTSG